MNGVDEFAGKEAQWAQRATRAQAAAAQALERLLHLAETRDVGRLAQ